MIKIVNYTICANLNCNLKLKEIARISYNVEYKNKMCCLSMKIRSPKTTCLIFKNGKMVLTGSTSRESGRIALRKFARKIQKLGYDVKLNNISVKNIVASYDFGFKIDLNKFATNVGIKGSFEPELFPGAKFTSTNNCQMRIFRSGKAFFTGVTNERDFDDAFVEIFYYIFIA